MTTLFLKYRPQTFADLVGQDAVIKTLQNALKADRPAHAYLFVGSRGTGKTSTARLLSKGLNCTDLQNGAPCGKCHICETTANGSLVDVIEIDAASHTGVDNIRDLREKANFMPNIAKRKIYIIDEVHMLSKGAFNALLKTLEEPPSHTFFILATTEFDKVPETIVSRCQTFTFGRFTLDQLVQRLQMICEKEGFTATTEALELIARKAEGGLRDAISLLEQLSAETGASFDAVAVRKSLGISSSEQLHNFYIAISNNNPTDAFAVLKDINQKGGDFRSFGHDFLNYLREKMYEAMQSPEQLSIIIKQIDGIEEAVSKFRTSPIVELPLEIAVVKLCTNYSSPQPTKQTQATVSRPIIQAPQPVVAQPKPARTDFIFDASPSKPPNTTESIPKAAQPAKPVTPTPAVKGDMSSSKIKELLPSIAENSGLATFVKKSLLTTRPQVEGNIVSFIANSQFHCEQLEKANISMKLEKSLEEAFKATSIKVIFKTSSAQTDSSRDTTATIDDLEF